MQFRFFSVVLVMLVALVMVGGATPAHAAPYIGRVNSWTVNSIQPYLISDCNFANQPQGFMIYHTLDVTWAQGGPYAFAYIYLYDASGTPIASVGASLGHPWTGALTYDVGMYPWSPVEPIIPLRPWRMVLRDNDGNGEEVASIIFDPADYGICSNVPYVGISNADPIIDTTAQDTAIYNSLDDDGNLSLDVYGIDEEGAGYYVFTITQDDLAPYVDNPPAQNTEIESVGDVTLYVLDTGEFQLNIGPDEEGKVRVVIFDGLPVITVYSYDFNVYDILDPDAN